MGRVYLQVYRLPINPLVVSCYPGCLILDFSSDILELCESSIRYMVEFCPFLSGGSRCPRVVLDVVIGRHIYELKDKRSTSDNPTPSREEILSDNVF